MRASLLRMYVIKNDSLNYLAEVYELRALKTVQKR